MKKRRTMMESPRFQSVRESKIFYASAAEKVSRPTKSMLVTQKVQIGVQTTKLKSSSRAIVPEAASMRVT